MEILMFLMDVNCHFFFVLYILPRVYCIWNYIAFLVFSPPTISFCFHILLLHDKSSKTLVVYKKKKAPIYSKFCNFERIC